MDLHGHVVGIPTLAASDPELGGAAAGIGFAIPSSLVSDIAGQIVQHGHVVNSHRSYLGVQLATGLSSGAVVAAVQGGSRAAHAGVVAGDVIDSINGQQISNPSDVAGVLAALKPGQNVPLQITKPDGSQSTSTSPSESTRPVLRNPQTAPSPTFSLSHPRAPCRPAPARRREPRVHAGWP